MNREIKFRGKNKIGWIKGVLSYQNIKNEIVPCIYDGYMYCVVNQNTICQFIGLCDKKSKEAYFNDIVKFTPKVLNRFGSEYIDANYELLAVIEANEYNHSVLRILHNKGQFKKNEVYHIEGLLNGEIVGNIYDNKELLETNLRD